MKKEMQLITLVAIGVLVGLFTACNNDGGDGIHLDNSACAKISKCLGDSMPLEKICKILCVYQDFGMGTENLDDTVLKVEQAFGRLFYQYKDDCEGLKAKLALTDQDKQQCKDGEGFCDGNILVDCGDDQRFDCTEAGLKCVNRTHGGAMCAEGHCKEEKISCLDRTTIRICSDGTEYHKNCELYGGISTVASAHQGGEGVVGGTIEYYVSKGGVCNPNAKSLYKRCIGAGDECGESDFHTHCDGSVLVSCVNGRVSRFDCSMFRENCVDFGHGLIDCGRGKECKPFDSGFSCEDGKLKFCWAGVWETVDCKAAGAKGCKAIGMGEGHICE